jgi:hypothetical protein
MFTKRDRQKYNEAYKTLPGKEMEMANIFF